MTLLQPACAPDENSARSTPQRQTDSFHLIGHGQPPDWNNPALVQGAARLYSTVEKVNALKKFTGEGVPGAAKALLDAEPLHLKALSWMAQSEDEEYTAILNQLTTERFVAALLLLGDFKWE